MNRPLVALVVLDGWGLAPPGPGNAVALARTPTADALDRDWPRTELVTHGRAVGLPPGQMGNSEVGHLNLGAGRTVWQDLTRIDLAIEDGSFSANAALRAALVRPRVHVVGLLSEGGVHSRQGHLHALLELARDLGRRGDQVLVHAITDGRDSAPTGGVACLRALAEAMARTGVGRLATVVGRYWAMDRDKRWERTARAFFALTRGEGEVVDDPVSALEAAYTAGTTDEFAPPFVVRGAPRIAPSDAVVCTNFRADRMRQLVPALADPTFSGFDRGAWDAARTSVTTFTRYDETYPHPIAFAPQSLEPTLGDLVARAGIPQLRLAETEKYAHVTYFFNGGREAPSALEERVLVPSPRVATYDLAPEMSAAPLADQAIRRIEAGWRGLIVLNFANPDMVGHTGSLAAARLAVEATDTQLGRLLSALERAQGKAIVTADHGNAEQMLEFADGEQPAQPRAAWPTSAPTGVFATVGTPHTAHTTNPVPLWLVDPARRGAALARGRALSAVAPTLCRLLGIEPAPEMVADLFTAVPGDPVAGGSSGV